MRHAEEQKAKQDAVMSQTLQAPNGVLGFVGVRPLMSDLLS